MPPAACLITTFFFRPEAAEKIRAGRYHYQLGASRRSPSRAYIAETAPEKAKGTGLCGKTAAPRGLGFDIFKRVGTLPADRRGSGDLIIPNLDAMLRIGHGRGGTP